MGKGINGGQREPRQRHRCARAARARPHRRGRRRQGLAAVAAEARSEEEPRRRQRVAEVGRGYNVACWASSTETAASAWLPLSRGSDFRTPRMEEIDWAWHMEDGCMGRKAYRREALRLEKELGDYELRAHAGLNGNRALGWVHCGGRRTRGARYGLHAKSIRTSCKFSGVAREFGWPTAAGEIR
ncbi:unnamed protein product [Miscanthus lutarioriparius]|uniref:Uncharacterized protein n=1 Tax=Miscanthus lutarioriparius TaxID=422564 RepID=A0A811SPE8_9POAL|nr:unnamed protein product [Miscanthus lutarioriparius]